VPEFEETAHCRASAREVWRLLYDPARFGEWWEGTERVDIGREGVTRYTDQYPGVAFPTTIASRSEGGRVTISCVLTDIVFDWTLEPAPAGCDVRLAVRIPEREAGRLAGQRAAMRASVRRLVEAAERARA